MSDKAQRQTAEGTTHRRRCLLSRRDRHVRARAGTGFRASRTSPPSRCRAAKSSPRKTARPSASPSAISRNWTFVSIACAIRSRSFRVFATRTSSEAPSVRCHRNEAGSSASPTGKPDNAGEIRSFVRDQVSHGYRSARRTSTDKQEIAQRVVLNETSFAQVPLLNPDQLVTSWRELLPDRRDAEYRRIPLEIKQQPGVYLVEAVSNLLRAYTIVIVSDLGLVTKTAPGQVLMFAADRFSGEPKPGCDVQVLANQKALGGGQTDADGTLAITLPSVDAEDIVGIVRCGDEVTATDPGGWFAKRIRARAGRLHLHGQADLSPRTHRPSQSRPALARARRGAALRSTERRDRRLGHQRQGGLPSNAQRGRVRRARGHVPGARDSGPGVLQRPRHLRRSTGQRRLRGAGVSPSRIRGDRHARGAVRRAGQRRRRHRAGALLLRSARRQRARPLRRQSAGVLLASALER